MDRATALAQATEMTRAGRLAEATDLIRRTLAGTPGDDPGRQPPDAAGAARCAGGLRDLVRKHVTAPRLRVLDGGLPGVTLPGGLFDGGLPRVNLPGGGLPGGTLPGGGLPGGAGVDGPPAPPADEGLPGETTGHVHRGPAGSRPYLLHVPTTGTGPRPLVVMLHGGTQTAADFATATGMNRLAQEHGFLVAYPEQVTSANAMRYWNWFRPGDQHRGGEPAILAAIVAEVAAAHDVDPDRVYVAGFSAGAAMAAVLGAAYPDVFAAVGVHSGLPQGCAHDVASAFGAMREAPRVRPLDRPVPVIAFHGDGDTTVAPGNATRVVEQCTRGAATGDTLVERGPGRPATRTVVRRDGVVVGERWTVHGSGHAWSGGTAGGSYTDPAGPDASAEMARFFLAQRRS